MHLYLSVDTGTVKHTAGTDGTPRAEQVFRVAFTAQALALLVYRALESHQGQALPCSTLQWRSPCGKPHTPAGPWGTGAGLGAHSQLRQEESCSYSRPAGRALGSLRTCP